MIRISVDWDFISPSLKIVSGIVKVYRAENIRDFECLGIFRTKCEVGSVGFSALDGTSGVSVLMFESIRSHLHSHVRNFFDGVMMDNFTYEWIDEEDLERESKERKKLLAKLDNKTFKLTPLDLNEEEKERYFNEKIIYEISNK